ncbi:MAG: dihydrolipoyl dehydrogenase [Propionibacteriaceae bacterium]|jgi:dihydrolipoamide dehydrogenase|nr:dihydrolipoyl dehydrogenase [Propionibacteriaceae bacterium]
MTQFDTVILGAGPGGYVAAIRCAQLGMKTAIVEKRWWGGVCLNVGCIPTKSLLANADLAHTLTFDRQLYGIVGDVSLDWGPAYARSRAVSDRMVKGVHFLMRKNKITEYSGWATLSDAQHLRVESEVGEPQELSFDNLILATGATPKMLPGVSPGPRVWTYEQLILSDRLPKSIIICGAGPIGSEFAYILASYGVKVTIVEYLDRLLPLEDPQVSSEVAKAYRRLGVTVLANHSVTSVEQDDQSAKVTVSPNAGSDPFVIEADAVLVSVGFTPRTTGYGLESTAVSLDGRGAIQIDDQMRTTVDNIYAIGDVTGKLMLAHTAQAQAIIAAESIGGMTTLPIDYAMIPRATYTRPQVASFGYTEEQARDRGHDVIVSKFPFTANGKAQGLGEAVGFVKIIADASHHELLGAHLVGPDVTELLPELTLAQKWDLTADEVARNIHAHPTLSEAIGEAAEGIGGAMINF